MKRYAILPGSVRSASDGQTHFINAGQLMRLYNVTLDECIVLHNIYDISKRGMGLILLSPRDDGDYRLPHR